jgi:hypothetical protein
MKQPPPPTADPFIDNVLGTRPADPALGPASWPLCQFHGATFTRSFGARLDGNRSGYAVPARRARIHVLLMALVFALVLGRASTAGCLAGRQATLPFDVPTRATTPVRAVPNTVLGLARHDGRCTLRSGKCRHAVFVAVGLDDPNDDETSDDPGDDDDGWEGLDAFGETEAPVTAWLEEISCFNSDLKTRSEPLWSEPLLFTSFLTLQRLRC